MKTKTCVIFAGTTSEPEILTCLDLFTPCWADTTVIYDHILCEKTLKDSLGKALSHAPHISGRIKFGDGTKPMLTAEDEGVLFTSISYDENISCLTSCNSLHFERLNTTLNQINQQSLTDEYSPVLQIMLSIYQNASILTLFINHLVFDLLSVANFLDNWSKVARGLNPVPLTFNRDLLRQGAIGNGESIPHAIMPVIETKNCPKVEITAPRIRRTFRIEVNKLNKWKHIAAAHNISQRGIKYCLLPAQILKLTSKFRASERKNIGYVQLNNLRSILGLSRYYFGNVVEGTSFEISSLELSRTSFPEIAKKIWSLREILANKPGVTGKAIAFWERKMRQGQLHNYLRKSFDVLCDRGELQLNDCSKISLYDVDFGSGKPSWHEVPLIGRSFPGRVCVILSAPEKNGDLILHAVFPESEMNELCKHFTPVPGS